VSLLLAVNEPEHLDAMLTAPYLTTEFAASVVGKNIFARLGFDFLPNLPNGRPATKQLRA
jgi:hypothetical protein